MDGSVFCIGNAAGFSGDRIDAAAPVVDTLIKKNRPAALFFEVLAERTLALAQLRRQRDPAGGFEPQLEALLAPVLERCVAHGIPIIGNFGAANPRGAATCIARLARRIGLNTLAIGVVEGDDIRADIDPDRLRIVDSDAGFSLAGDEIVAANVYLGAAPIAEALSRGAQVVVTGRVADPALALGPLIHHFGWSMDDWDRLAAGTTAGHLLECGSQVSGGYFADPGWKDVPDPANIGFPIAEVSATGELVITKAAATGGLVDARTVKEQLLYEVHDPAAYLTPDVVLDMSGIEVTEIGADRVRVRGARGRARPATLKATVCVRGGWLGEAEISYAGPNALARARLAAETLRERLRRRGLNVSYRFDFIGVCSVLDNNDGTLAAQRMDGEYDDIRVRLATAAAERDSVEQACKEVVALLCCGPAGGGGARWRATPRIKTVSCLVPRVQVRPRVAVIPVEELVA